MSAVARKPVHNPNAQCSCDQMLAVLGLFTTEERGACITERERFARGSRTRQTIARLRKPR
jgi:hypothetical protein